MRTYGYVGPADIKARSAGQPAGRVIRTTADVSAWIRESHQAVGAGGTVPATFIIDSGQQLLVADRHSEHVACAGGGDVLAAGEIFFIVDVRSAVFVAEISNQSTGYCPEPSCWEVVETVLDRIGLDHPPGFTAECVFRKCPECGARNIVKEAWFYCDVCGHELPAEWNFEGEVNG